MFFTKLAIALSAALLASATPVPSTSGSCNTGAVQCCNSVQSANSTAASDILGLLGVVVQDITAPVGLDCSPINVIGLGSSGSCSSNTVCCQDNSYGGLISIGCLPITL